MDTHELPEKTAEAAEQPQRARRPAHARTPGRQPRIDSRRNRMPPPSDIHVECSAEARLVQPRSYKVEIVCIIRYEIDPHQRDAFEHYAAIWGRVIPRCGGRLIGYFLPWQGTNFIGWGLIAFDGLAAYETYQMRLRQDPEGRDNFAFAHARRFILKEERSFVEVVDGTFGIAPRKGTSRHGGALS